MQARGFLSYRLKYAGPTSFAVYLNQRDLTGNYEKN